MQRLKVNGHRDTAQCVTSQWRNHNDHLLQPEQLGTNSHRLLYQVLSNHMIQTVESIPSFEKNTDTYLIT